MEKRKRELKTIETEYRIMYYSALVVLSALLIAAIIFRIFGDNILNDSNGCQFRAMTGFYCPGCGGTRAFYYLSHFQIGKSIYYHFVVAFAIVSMILYALNCFLYRRIEKLHFLMNPYVLLCSGAILVLIRMVAINMIYFMTGVPLL